MTEFRKPDPPPRFEGFSGGFKTAREREFEAAHLAWDDFFNRPVAVWEVPPPPEPEPVRAATNHVPDWRESQQILKDLLEQGRLKTSR